MPAKYCTPVVSSWVSKCILLCDSTLAVEFKRGVHHRHRHAYGGVPGVTCWYPNTTRADYDL